jgi:hypothetical protein
MTSAMLQGFSMVAAAMSDTRTFTAREAHLDMTHKFTNPDTFRTADGAKFVWCEARNLFVRSV